jgi:phosphate transport system substrate-binding protein
MDNSVNSFKGAGMKKALRVMAAGLALMLGGVAAQAQETLNLTGAGATFPQPMYAKWISEYTKANSSIKINYQGVGSGAGIKQITENTVDFGATDGPMTDKQLEKASGILHIPTVMGAVVPIYNLEGVDKPVQFDGAVLADIFAGKIRKWNDAALAKLNPDIKLPATAIVVAHRSDSSGTTYVFTDYLAKVSADWKDKVGSGTSVKWPTGVGAKGNAEVAGVVQKTKGAIGYVELIYAMANKIAYGDVQNAAGKFVHATAESVSAAAVGMKNIPEDLRVSITNAEGDASYPISTFTWILVYQNQKDAAKGKAVVEFLWWATHDGQRLAADLHYAPLPEDIVKLCEKKLQSVQADGKAILPAK